MMKARIYSFFLLLLCSLTLFGQSIDVTLSRLMGEGGGMNARTDGGDSLRGQAFVADTAMWRQRVNVRFDADGSVCRLCIIGRLREEAECPEARLDALGVRRVCTLGRMVIMDVPAAAYGSLCKMEEFAELNADYVNRTFNDGARVSNAVSYVNGENPAESLGGTTYDGSGVVLGVIDSGIDFNHIAFKKADGSTRIGSAVTFDSNHNLVATSGDAIANLTTGNTSTSHGTHTAATAGGSVVDGLQLHGMAPGADLVLCDCSSGLYDSHVIQSAQHICTYATTAGKPVVINCSFGATVDFHDGNNNLSNAFSTLAHNMPGRIFCVSAGNSAHNRMSVSKTLRSGEVLKTVLKATALDETSNGSLYANGLSCLIYATDGNPFTIGYRAVDVTSGTEYTLAEKPLYNAAGEEVNLGSTVTLDSGHGKYFVKLYVAGALHFADADLHLGIHITPGADNQRIIVLDDNADNNTKSSYLTGSGEYHALTGYADGGGDQSFNIIACTDDVISVGAYRDRDNWKSIDGNSYYSTSFNSTSHVGGVVPFSSYGVDDNGVARPDVIATGTYIVSAFNRYCTADVRTVCKEVVRGGDTYRYGAMSGTSMSAPVVSGIVALWLQAKPSLTTAEVRELLRQSCRNDEYTRLASNTPSGNLVQVGLGKIDALRGIEQLMDNVATHDVLTIPAGRSIATFASRYKLDFSDPDLPKAYIAAEMEGSTLRFKRVRGCIPENTGLLVVADGGEYSIPVAPSATAVESNYLVGTADGSVRMENEGECYVLSSQGGKNGFYMNAAGLTIPQGKAYLVLPAGGAGEARSYAIVLDEEVRDDDDALPEGSIGIDGDLIANLVVVESDTETGISSICDTAGHDANDTAIYDLTGRRVRSTSLRGIYISGGGKVIRR